MRRSLQRRALAARDRARPTVPHDLETIIEKAIAREPAQRYPTAAALADDLQRFLDDKPIQARQAPRRADCYAGAGAIRGWPTLLAAVTALMILVTSGSSTAAIWLNRERDRTRAAYARE